MNDPAKGTSPAVGLWRRFSSTVVGSGPDYSRDFFVAENTSRAIGHADFTGDLAAADSNGSRRWS